LSIIEGEGGEGGGGEEEAGEKGEVDLPEGDDIDLESTSGYKLNQFSFLIKFYFGFGTR